MLPLLALALAASSPAYDHTEAPRFVVQGDDTDRLPLRATHTKIQVAGVVAHVVVEQTWANEGQRPIAASYVFPAGTRAAVSALRMKIGERTIEAKIAEKKAAREQYEQAKSEGKTASLLEQERPNMLAIEVANILPRDVIEVTLEYSELIVPQGGVYELSYPQVVGPRYTGAGESESWATNPYVDGKAAFPYRWSLDATLSAGMGIEQIASPSHSLKPRFSGKHDVAVALEQRAGDPGGDRDFVLRWRLAKGAIDSGVLLYRDRAGENFFLALVEPPARVDERDMPPRELVFVVDVSGSMSGFPLATAKALARRLLEGMRPSDSFNIVFFAGSSFLLARESLPATSENVAKAMEALTHVDGGGGTELDGALARALSLPTDTRTTSRTFVLITDGYVSFEKKVFRTIRESLGAANVFAFGIGSSVNRYLIEGVAKAGLGEPFVVLDEREAERASARFAELVSRPALTNVTVAFEGLDAYDVEPKHIPDLFEDRPLVVFGKYRGSSSGRVRVRGLAGKRPFEKVVTVSDHLEKKEHAVLRSLWARERVAQLADFDDAGEQEIAELTRLGLAYSLLTQYTSFVAVDERARNDRADIVDVVQPIPAPAGVSAAAFGSLRSAAMSQSYGAGGLGLGGIGRGGGGAGVDMGGRGKGMTRVQPGKTIVLGSLSKDDVQRVIRAKLNQLRHCYERELARDPTLAGRVVLSFTIDESGLVSKVVVVDSSLGNKSVEECLTRVFARMRFAVPAGGGTVEVRYPLNFNAAR